MELPRYFEQRKVDIKKTLPRTQNQKTLGCISLRGVQSLNIPEHTKIVNHERAPTTMREGAPVKGAGLRCGMILLDDMQRG